MQVRQPSETSRVAAPLASSVVRSMASGSEVQRLAADGDGVAYAAKSSSSGNFLEDGFLEDGVVLI